MSACYKTHKYKGTYLISRSCGSGSLFRRGAATGAVTLATTTAALLTTTAS